MGLNCSRGKIRLILGKAFITTRAVKHWTSCQGGLWSGHHCTDSRRDWTSRDDPGIIKSILTITICVCIGGRGWGWVLEGRA